MESDQTPAELTGAMLDAIGLFESLQIGYALVGGLAAMVYGRARFTVDVDFVAQSNHEKQLAAHPEVMRSHRFDHTCTWKLYHTSGAQIDIWKDEYADQIISRAQTVTLAKHATKIVEPHDLIAMKLRAGRIQDDYDISQVLKHTAIDDTIIKSRVTSDLFDAYLAIKRRSEKDRQGS